MGISFGAGDEARTRYLDLGKVALYQMSYARKSKVNYNAAGRVCQQKNQLFSRISMMPIASLSG